MKRSFSHKYHKHFHLFRSDVCAEKPLFPLLWAQITILLLIPKAGGPAISKLSKPVSVSVYLRPSLLSFIYSCLGLSLVLHLSINPLNKMVNQCLYIFQRLYMRLCITNARTEYFPR